MIACTVCGRPGRWQQHHPTGKACASPDAHSGDGCDCYLDPDFAIPACHDHHTLCHDDWYTLGIAKADPDSTMVDTVELRLRRLAATLARIPRASAETSLDDLLYAELADVLVVWADVLRLTILLLDEVAPEWRDDRRFYSPTRPAGG